MSEAINPTYLIGGPPGGGKTTLAVALAERLGVQCFSIDDIRTALLSITTPESHPELHIVGLPDPWTYFTAHDPDTLVEHAESQHVALWPGVERVIRKHQANSRGLVIEGWHLMPRLVAATRFEHAVPAWLDVDSDVLETRERSIWEFYAKSADPDTMFQNFLARSIRWNTMMRDQAKDASFRLLHQDGSKSLDELVAELLS